MPPEQQPPPDDDDDNNVDTGGGPSASDLQALLEYIRHFSFGNDGDYTGNAGYGGDNIGPPGSKEPEQDVPYAKELLDSLMAPPTRPSNGQSHRLELNPFSNQRPSIDEVDPFTGRPSADPFLKTSRPGSSWSGAPLAVLRHQSLLASPYLLAENEVACNSNRATCLPPTKSDFNQSSLANLIQAELDPTNVAIQAHEEGTAKIVVKTINLDMHKIASKAVAIAQSDQYKRAAAVSRAERIQRSTATAERGQTSTRHWTTQTEWSYPPPDARLIQPVTHYDSGNATFNFVANKLVLPWRNVLAFYGNIPLAALMGIDDAARNSPTWSSTYQASQDLLPLSRTMGLALEVGPALSFASSWMSSLQSVPTYSFQNAVGASGEIQMTLSEVAAASSVQPARETIHISGLGRVGEITSKPTFRSFVTRAVRAPNHPLHRLIDPETNKLRPSTTKGLTELHWFEDPRIVEAGHWSSAKALGGTPDRLIIMSAYENRLASAVIEHPSIGGIMAESGHVVSIGGIPVDLKTAEALVEFGVLDAEVLAEAPFILF